MSDEKDIITIDEVEYDFAELEDNQQYYVTQLRRLNIKTTEARMELDQISAAHDMFKSMLVNSVKETKPEPEKSKK